jgi:hypothetical protein
MKDTKYAITGPQTIPSVFGHHTMLWYYLLSLFRSLKNITYDDYRLEVGGVLPGRYLLVEY